MSSSLHGRSSRAHTGVCVHVVFISGSSPSSAFFAFSVFFFGVGLSAPEGLASVAVTVALFGQFDLPDLPLLDFCCGFSSSAIAVLMRRAAPCFLFSVMGAGYIGLRYIVFFINLQLRFCASHISAYQNGAKIMI